MANGDQILSLLRYHFNGDNDAFRKQALQISISEAQAGHTSLARAIRDIAMEPKQTTSFQAFSLQNSELSDLLMIGDGKQRLSNFVAPDSLTQRIKRIIAEYAQREKLYSYNLDCRRKVMLVGHSGTGKTMTASILANELNMPLYVVRIENIITKFMGETSMKLAKIFDWIPNHTGVYLFDEFDAIGQKRGIENEVGEMRRILNTFLQLLERDQSQSLILAATNDIDRIDKALFRRFDDILQYSLPTPDEIMQIIKLQTAGIKIEGNLDSIINEFVGMNHAEICMVIHDAIKDSLLQNQRFSTDLLLGALMNRNSLSAIG